MSTRSEPRLPPEPGTIWQQRQRLLIGRYPLPLGCARAAERSEQSQAGAGGAHNTDRRPPSLAGEMGCRGSPGVPWCPVGVGGGHGQPSSPALPNQGPTCPSLPPSLAGACSGLNSAPKIHVCSEPQDKNLLGIRAIAGVIKVKSARWDHAGLG